MSRFKGAERRGFGRRESLIHGTAVIAGRGVTACVVRNFSAGGALITFNEPLVPPYQFRLVIAERRIDVPVEVRHHGRYGTGVRFMETIDISAFCTPVPRGRTCEKATAAEPAPSRPLEVRELRRQMAGQLARQRGLLERLLSV